jgi:o-succinylbenzoate synthase
LNLYRQKNSVFVTVKDDCHTGIGEASPLAGYSAESPDDVIDYLKDLKKRIKNITINNTEDIISFCSSPAPLTGLPSSGLFAMESALLDLLGKQKNLPVWKLLNKTDNYPDISINALLTVKTSAAEINRLLNSGINTFKVKTGRTSLKDELLFLQRLRNTAGDRAVIRLDANGLFTVDEAKNRIAAYTVVNPEFIEEPVSGTDMLKLKKSPVPIGADESLADITTKKAIINSDTVSVIVIKPALQHGIFNSLKLADQAAKKNKKITVTHMMDGPVALTACVHLAFALPQRPLACGLYPARSSLVKSEHSFIHQIKQGLLSRPEESGAGISSNTVTGHLLP